MTKKILWVKFGWSDYYRGGPVDGNFGWLNEQRGGAEEGRGHEAYNFLPVNETYYSHVPPQAKTYAPSNNDDTGWTVVCLAKRPKHKGIHIVGWYENATLIGKWKKVPQDHPDQNFSYCITSESAFFVPPEFRINPFSHPSVRYGKYSFLAGPNVEQTQNKTDVLKLLSKRMAALVKAKEIVTSPSETTIPDPEVDSSDPLKGFGTAEHRKKVEVAAEACVIKHYEQKGFTSQRVTHLPCGFDFVFSKGRTKIHVEVKGTASNVPQFFLTRNEHANGMQSNPAWRLAMVTQALTANPKIDIYEAGELSEEFDLEPYVFLGKFIPKSEG
jgi:hypothetical protein